MTKIQFGQDLQAERAEDDLIGNTGETSMFVNLVWNF